MTERSVSSTLGAADRPVQLRALSRNPLSCQRISLVFWLERETGLEPATSTLGRLHSTIELLPRSAELAALGWRGPFSASQWYGSAWEGAAGRSWAVRLYGLGQEEHQRCCCHPEEDERPEWKRGLPCAYMCAGIQTQSAKIAERNELGHRDADPDPGGGSEHSEDARHHPSQLT